ncbi:hypothetical protein K437DRAFT_259847 [Tilletiaria anomala UBC 951]|uniref:Elongation of fatty acids protein n=1 Tax=Tilletiaria anomala (strain ATCC 24038 / CBS 436.72 / UBC 951) TaxID=1037660 RepID=A0A066V678_TILAU|nr:uncharacterized protein K437DRAFT_259847 [Tilletiaria anomala UBC 951]KDN37252.1 hypothetical protein K437DRAFT_259847 [Tilletiaria anomala UBC 951]
MPLFTTSPFPPNPLLVQALDFIFPHRYPFDHTSKTILLAPYEHNRSAYDAIVSSPNPPYPFEQGSILNSIFPSTFYTESLRSVYPLYFAVAYYVLAHWLSGAVKRNGSKDYVKGNPLLRFIVLVHNAFLMLFSAWTWIHVFPVAVDYISQGLRGAGFEGVKLALCTFSTEARYLNKFNYLFYLSKYYEVVDSVILLLKGRQVGQLQSYHHAGALISMWIAVRFGSECVWVFTTWNSFVHTLMYTYYLFTALHLPFPRTLKRSLTSLQIAQIASGTLATNLYWFLRINPGAVLQGIAKRHVGSTIAAASLIVRQFFSFQESPVLQSTEYTHLDLAHNARFRQESKSPTSCFDTTGATLALWVNTFYMLPLLFLFAQFFVNSYISGGSASRKGKANRYEHKTLANGNGKAKT